MQHIQDAAEAKIRRCLASLPDGTATFREQTDEGDPLVVTITMAGESATIDFTGTAPPLPTNLNANRGIVTAAVLYCLRCLIDEDIPLNAGVLKPVRLVLPECFLNPPEHPDPAQCAAVVGGNVETSQRCVDAIFGALGVVAASQGTMNNLTFGNARFGYYETICGGSGAGPGFHGTSGVHTHMTNTRLTDPEVLESQYPVRLHYFSLRPGSGGRGRWRGGDGIIRELEFLEPVELSMLTQRRTTRPYGMKGGEPGAAGLNLLRLPGESVYTAMPPRFTCAVPAGTRLRVETPGGGGWGAP
jgi:5-oxoprolinase (ATP-hydrolysing)